MPPPVRVLVVDDEENIRWSLERALTHAGFTVRAARSVEDAKQELLEHGFDAVLTDLRLPGEDGIALLDWARANRPAVRLILATAYGSPDVRQEALRAGALSFLEKPIDIDALCASLRACEGGLGPATDLRSIRLLDIVRALWLGQATRSLEVTGDGGGSGRLDFVQGEVVSARAGAAAGDAAFFEIARWSRGSFRELAAGAPPSNDVKLTTRELLAEAARFCDGIACASVEIASAPAATFGARSPAKADVDRAVEIAPDVFWVGRRNPRSLLQVNVYLRRFRKGAMCVNLLVDPGSPVDLPVISSKVAEVAGGVDRVDLFSVNHQDPDVVANAPFVQRMNPKAICLTSEDTWRLVSHYGLDPARVRLTETFPDGRMRLATGHAVEFVPTPYCHFRGAVALYDLESRVLFTGDLFGGLSPSGHRELYASDASWSGIKTFHEIYMPSRRALQRAAAAIRALEVLPRVIAPQHGDVLVGDQVEQTLERLASLPVGSDLFDSVPEGMAPALWRDAANEVIDVAAGLLGRSRVFDKLSARGARARLLPHVVLDGARVRSVLAASPLALARVEALLAEGEPYELANQLHLAALESAARRGLPVQTGLLEGGDLQPGAGGEGLFL